MQILSRIIKYTVAETAHMTLDEIINCIEQNSIQIGNIPIAPGLTNTERVTTLQTEDATAGESYITFDLRFSLTLPHKSVKIIINLEAQKTTDASKLGYHLSNRITYYMARLISSQKETEFFHTEYDNLKKVYSIWICLECAIDAIDEVRLTSKNIYGIVEDPFKYALAYLLRGARHALHDIFLLRTSAIRRRLHLGRRLDSHQD